MEKEVWKPGNMLYPVPAVMVSCADKAGNSNIITVAWAGTVCSDPVMVSISVRKDRFSHHMLKETGEFVINLTTEELARQTDGAGVRSGRDLNKWEYLHLTPERSEKVAVPRIAESPVNLECRVTQVLELGSHDMFLAEVLAVCVDRRLLDPKGRLDLGRAKLIAYSHGGYYALGELLGTFGYSVRKTEKKAGKPEKAAEVKTEIPQKEKQSGGRTQRSGKTQSGGKPQRSGKAQSSRKPQESGRKRSGGNREISE